MTMLEDRGWATPEWREWVPDAAFGVAVLFIGIYEAATTTIYANQIPDPHASRVPMLLVALGIAIAVSLSRRAQRPALGLVWLTCGMQLVYGVPLLLTELTVAAVSFGTARWGRPTTVILSALSIPAAGSIAVMFSGAGIFRRLINLANYQTLIDATRQFGGTWQIGAILLAMAVLGAPWLAGLAFRFNTRAVESRATATMAQEAAALAQRDSEQAREIARLRDEQAQLARDVHDVVGHSLAVILAQAEAAQFLPDDPEKLKGTMATIATSARSSLQDVRQVLSATKQPTAPANGGLDSLIEGVRASGNSLESAEIGQARRLPPELEVVAYRVLQEMLTNAITHGRRDQPFRVERHWPDSPGSGNQHVEADFRIEVRNVAGSTDGGVHRPGGGQGLVGMRRRLEAVGGRLDVRRREEPHGVTFTTTAWIPVRAR
jgi:signal transduction histidine kinase